MLYNKQKTKLYSSIFIRLYSIFPSEHCPLSTPPQRPPPSYPPSSPFLPSYPPNTLPHNTFHPAIKNIPCHAFYSQPTPLHTSYYPPNCTPRFLETNFQWILQCNSYYLFILTDHVHVFFLLDNSLHTSSHSIIFLSHSHALTHFSTPLYTPPSHSTLYTTHSH